MEINRRQGIIGSLFGALWASTGSPGTETAKYNLTEQAEAIMPLNYSTPKALYDHRKMVAEEVASLKAFLYEGKLSENQKSRMYHERSPTYLDIDSMKSITKATKDRMLNRYEKQKEYERWRKQAFKRLAYLMGWKEGMDIYNYHENDIEVSASTGKWS
jgi:hypothetical protein